MSTPSAVSPLPRRPTLSPAVLLRHAANLLPLVLVHVGAVAVAVTGGTWTDWAVLGAMFYARGTFQTIGYHRYFAHRSFSTGRVVQFLLAAGCCANLQQGPLWWAVYHRHHHRHSDGPGDPHSPFHGGFWWAYCGWLFVPLDPDWRTVKDLSYYPELRWLERFWQLPGLLAAGLFWLAGGWSLVCVGFCLSAVVIFHMTFAVNTVAHLVGSRRYATADRSRNSFVLAALTMGDGWHNNHHYYPHAAQAGFRWFEIDGAFRLIRLMERLGLVWGVRRVPARVLEAP